MSWMPSGRSIPYVASRYAALAGSAQPDGTTLDRLLASVTESNGGPIDDDVAVIGSSNMDTRSFALNSEVSMMLTGADIVARFRKVEDDYRALSRELTLEEWGQRSFWQRYLDNTMRLTAALQ